MSAYGHGRGHGASLEWSIATRKGKKNEDRVGFFGRVPGLFDAAVVLCDGHNGSRAAELCVRNLIPSLVEKWRESGGRRRGYDAALRGLLRETFLDCDNCCKAQFPDGSTCTVVLVRQMAKSRWEVQSVWVGDSSAVVVRGMQHPKPMFACFAGTLEAEPLTWDHRPTSESERRRLHNFYLTDQARSMSQFCDSASENSGHAEQEQEEEPVIRDWADRTRTLAPRVDSDTQMAALAEEDGDDCEDSVHFVNGGNLRRRKMSLVPNNVHAVEDFVQARHSFVGHYEHAPDIFRIFSASTGESTCFTRSIGDPGAARAVIAEPSFERKELVVPEGGTVRIVVASDGVWDVGKPGKVAAKANEGSHNSLFGTTPADKVAAWAHNTRLSLSLRMDDISVAVLDLMPFEDAHPDAESPRMDGWMDSESTCT